MTKSHKAIWRLRAKLNARWRTTARLRFGIAGMIGALLMWQVTSAGVRSPAMPSFIQVARTFWGLVCDKAFWPNIAASLQIVVSGIGIAMIAGLSVGIVLSQCQRLKFALMPVLECLRGISALTLFPLLIVLMGLGGGARVFVIFWTSWPAVLVSTLESLDAPQSIVEAARTEGAGEWQVLSKIRVPLAAPSILTGLRLGIGGGWISLMASEMLGASRGLGYYLLWSAQSFEFSKVYATILMIALIGGGMNWSMAALQGKVRKGLLGVDETY